MFAEYKVRLLAIVVIVVATIVAGTGCNQRINAERWATEASLTEAIPLVTLHRSDESYFFLQSRSPARFTLAQDAPQAGSIKFEWMWESRGCIIETAVSESKLNYSFLDSVTIPTVTFTLAHTLTVEGANEAIALQRIQRDPNIILEGPQLLEVTFTLPKSWGPTLNQGVAAEPSVPPVNLGRY
jgi:hypothetical protein